MSQNIKESEEKALWDDVNALLGTDQVLLGEISSALFKNNPLDLAAHLSKYKFISRMACKDRRIIELGCGEGLGSLILAEQARSYLGADTSAKALEYARKLQQKEACTFEEGPLFEGERGPFDTVISFNAPVTYFNKEGAFPIEYMASLVHENGLLVVGTDQRGKVRGQLKEELGKHFHNTFTFSMNEESVRSGLSEDADTAVLMACYKRF